MSERVVGVALNKKLVVTSGNNGGFTSKVNPFTSCLVVRNIEGLEIDEKVYTIIHTDADPAGLSDTLAEVYGAIP
jgi:hypothetical protein